MLINVRGLLLGILHSDVNQAGILWLVNCREDEGGVGGSILSKASAVNYGSIDITKNSAHLGFVDIDGWRTSRCDVSKFRNVPLRFRPCKVLTLEVSGVGDNNGTGLLQVVERSGHVALLSRHNQSAGRRRGKKMSGRTLGMVVVMRKGDDVVLWLRNNLDLLIIYTGPA